MKLTLLIASIVFVLAIYTAYIGCSLYACLTTFPILAILSFLLGVLNVFLIFRNSLIKTTTKMISFFLLVFYPLTSIVVAFSLMAPIQKIITEQYLKKRIQREQSLKTGTPEIGEFVNRGEYSNYICKECGIEVRFPSIWKHSAINELDSFQPYLVLTLNSNNNIVAKRDENSFIEYPQWYTISSFPIKTTNSFPSTGAHVLYDNGVNYTEETKIINNIQYKFSKKLDDYSNTNNGRLIIYAQYNNRKLVIETYFPNSNETEKELLDLLSNIQLTD